MYLTPSFGWLSYMVGGITFGVGMTLAAGCGQRNLVRFGGGNLKALVVLIVLGTTDASGVPNGFGPIAAGLGLTLVHLISIPVSNTSVNPARSLATAVFQGDWALGQVWAFIVFPLLGELLAGASWLLVGSNNEAA